ncbi:hypothetical protein IG631_12914 [Alternaria alternata]|nr:hypothetical protein IG631_12914 [Alternaria alternata]
MAEVTAIGTALAVLDLVGATSRTFTSNLFSAWFFLNSYGIVGPVLWLFGDRDVWRIQVRVLQSRNELDAMEFKKLAQDDSSIIAVAVSDRTPLETVYNTDQTCTGHHRSPDRHHCSISGQS